MPSNTFSYCTSCIVVRSHFNNITGSKKNFDNLNPENQDKEIKNRNSGTSSMGLLLNSHKLLMAIILILSLLLSHGEASILRGHRNRADRGGPTLTDGRQYQPSAGDPDPYCGPCDTRNCPLVSAETCQGQVVKDRCGCCPFCDTLKPAATLVSTENNNTAKVGCENIQCPRNKMCLLNIQNIPICRCPSTYYCRRQHVKGLRKEGDSHLCGRDGKTYRNRCLLQVAECASNKKIRVAHRGKCLSDTPTRKQRGNRKYNSKSVGVANGNNGYGGGSSDSNPMTQVISQYPSNANQYPSNRDKYSHSNRDRDATNADNKGKQQRRQKHHKIKENRRQRRKERINRRTKRRFRIYWL